MRFAWLFVCLPIIWCQASLKQDAAHTGFCLEGLDIFFLCPGGNRCINKRAVCDGRQDCSDNADERNCTCRATADCPKGLKCLKDLDAATSACVDCSPGQQFVKSQCEDINECKNPLVCAGRGSCVNRPNGYECVVCPIGYEADLRNFRLLSSDPAYNQSETFRKLLLCNDYNECKENSSCNGGVCFNRIGNFSCECPPNHERPPDAHENICQAVGEQPLIAIGNDSSIVVFDLRSATPVQELRWTEEIVDMTADRETVIIATRQQIWRYKLATESTFIVADFGSDEEFSKSTIRKISADWENHRVYVLTGDSVSVTDVAGRNVKIIEHRGNIYSIAVDPIEGYLFYSKSGHVRRTRLDGQAESTQTIFSALPAKDLDNVEVLAVDPNLRCVYYIHNGILYSFDYLGSRALIISTSAAYTRLEPFEIYLYATYRFGSPSSIVTLSRTGYGEKPGSKLVSFSGTLPKYFTIVQQAKFPIRQEGSLNGCASKPCTSDWCFPMPPLHEPSYTCVCAPEQRNNCIPLKINRLQPLSNYILPSDERVNMRESSASITARTSGIGTIIITFIVLVLLDSLVCFE